MDIQEINISIDGDQQTSFASFSLIQRMFGHHEFELVLNADITDEPENYLLDLSQKWIGKPFQVNLGEGDFMGIVTAVEFGYLQSLHGDVIVKGHSPTICLDAQPHICSWNEKTLSDIAGDTFGAAGLSANVSPQFSSPIEYLSQYKESHFAFLNRLAASYGEWFYYDGREIVFGQPADQPEIPLTHGPDFDQIQYSLSINPINFKGFAYNPLNDQSLAEGAPGSSSATSTLGKQAVTSSNESFSIAGNSSSGATVLTKADLESTTKNQFESKAANLVWIKGTGTKPELRPGVIADLSANLLNSGSVQAKSYGRYLIMNVYHHISGDFKYNNKFEAIPAECKVPPTPELKIPIAEPQVATVLSNTDPESKGRVQVQMLWQDSGMKSPWIRVMTPDAGSSDLHPKNRGFVFIPEVGDQVMVGFEHNNPSQPYVMGSLYHGLIGEGGKEANVLRTIITKGGHEIELDDTVGKEKITLKDKKGNYMVIDTAADSIFMKANGAVDIQASSINMLASGAIMMNAGSTLEGAAGANVTFGAGISTSLVSAMDTTIMAGKLMSITGGKSAKMGSGAGASIELESKGDAKFNSQKKMNISSKESSFLGSKKVLVKSEKAILEGSNKAVVKGNKVNVS